MILEKMFYEARPFLYALIGLYAVIQYQNKILFICGSVLLTCSYVVIDLRLSYRRKATQTSKSQLRGINY